MDLTNASAIVTGGAGGFGSATVHRLAQMGAKLVIADVSDERGEALAIQSSSPLGPEKKPSTVIVMENVSFLNGVLLRPIAK